MSLSNLPDNSHNGGSTAWFVLRAVFHNELAVRDGLRRAGLRCYVPMQYKVETIKGHKVRRLVPAITALVFVHASEEAIRDYKLRSKETVYWLTTPKGGQREKIIVPDKAMEDFIRISQQSEQAVTYFRPEELNMSKGDRILIHGGPFDGVEGILLKVKGKRDKQLIVSVPNIAAAAVCIRPDMVELKNRHIAPSRDSQGDARELIRLSTQMLTAAPDRLTQEHEYNMLYNEIFRLYSSLRNLKGYLPSLEGQISLSLLLAERTFGSITNTTLQRCRIAASHLRPSKLRDQLLEELSTWQD